MNFDEWVESLPANHWAKYDLAACKVGWEAAMKEFKAKCREECTKSADRGNGNVGARDCFEIRDAIEALEI